MGPIGGLGGEGGLGHHLRGLIGLLLALGGILTYLSEDPGLTTYFFPGRDGVGGGGYPDV